MLLYRPFHPLPNLNNILFNENDHLLSFYLPHLKRSPSGVSPMEEQDVLLIAFLWLSYWIVTPFIEVVSTIFKISRSGGISRVDWMYDVSYLRHDFCSVKQTNLMYLDQLHFFSYILATLIYA